MHASRCRSRSVKKTIPARGAMRVWKEPLGAIETAGHRVRRSPVARLPWTGVPLHALFAWTRGEIDDLVDEQAISLALEDGVDGVELTAALVDDEGADPSVTQVHHVGDRDHPLFHVAF